MYVLEEFAFVLLVSVVLTVFAALAGLAGWGLYRLISGGRQLILLQSAGCCHRFHLAPMDSPGTFDVTAGP